MGTRSNVLVFEVHLFLKYGMKEKQLCSFKCVHLLTNQNGRLSKLGNLVRVTVETFSEHH